MLLAKLRMALMALEFPGAVRAALTWPKFSFASFVNVSRMKCLGASPKIVIDVGANVGQFAVAAVKLFDNAQIYCIEPDEKTAERLAHNLKTFASVQIFVTAVSDEVGSADFYVNTDSQVSSLAKLGEERIRSFPYSKVVEKKTVLLTTLDELFNRASFNGEVLIKIDVQGLEDKVIRGANKILSQAKWVLIEVSFKDLYEGESDFQKIMALMDSQGFHFKTPTNFHVSPVTGEIIEMDALFIKS